MAVRVGTSGWVYPHFRGVLYPAGLPGSRWLSFYARVFGAVEVNGTFYRLPTEAAVDAWREAVPAGFVFAVKGSRFLTHMKRLTDTGQGLDRFFGPVLRLGPRLGPVLWQLPPQMTRPDPERLDRFLAAMPPGVRCAVEFRSEGWYHEEVVDVLRRHRAAFVEHDLVDRPVPRVTGGMRYLRFHGRTGRYGGRYGRARLRPVADELRAWAHGPRVAFAFFNNDLRGHAVRDALDLAALLGRPEPLQATTASAGT